MRLNYLANALGLTMIYIGLVILSPVIVALYYHDYSSIIPFVAAGLISASTGFILKNPFLKQTILKTLMILKSRSFIYSCSFLGNFRNNCSNSVSVLRAFSRKFFV